MLTGLVTSCVGTALLKHVIEGKKEEKIYEKRGRGKRGKQLLDGLTETTGYWDLQ